MTYYYFNLIISFLETKTFADLYHNYKVTGFFPVCWDYCHHNFPLTSTIYDFLRIFSQNLYTLSLGVVDINNEKWKKMPTETRNNYIEVEKWAQIYLVFCQNVSEFFFFILGKWSRFSMRVWIMEFWVLILLCQQ